ncbi:MAG: RimK family alpha-L-glutamate ligase [Candidatus Aenigmatarchaeota archaeon]
MNLLTITEDQSLGEKFEDYFEELHNYSIEDVKIDANQEEVVSYVGGRRVEDYDALFIRPTPKALTFTRIFLESIMEKDINTVMDGTSYYIIAKKPYLFKVLTEKNIPVPKTFVVSSEKSINGVKKEFDGDVVCKKFEGFERKDIMKTEDPDSIEAFSESLEHGKNYMVVQEFIEGEVYDCLYIDGDIISTKISSDSWRKSPKRDSSSEKYHKPPSDVAEIVENAAEAIGSQFCSVRLVDSKVVDMHMNPDVERFMKVSGKNSFEKIADMLKPEGEGEER